MRRVFQHPTARRHGGASEGPRRVWPRRGGALTLADVRGPWRPSGAVAAAGVFGVVWSTPGGERWAALHDFEPAAALRLIEACRDADEAARTGGWAS